MIQKVEMYQAVCDGCGKCDEAVLKDPYEVKLIAIRWREWEEIDGKLYCPDCVEYDEETDSYKPKGKEAMTVQELIDELNKIKDKQKKVLVIHTCGTDEFKIVQINEFENDVTIWTNEKEDSL